MIVDGKHYRTIWMEPNDPHIIRIIDQRNLPHKFIIEDIRNVDAMATAIREMHIRGAGGVGAAAGYGMYLAALEGDLEGGASKLLTTRPTAINIRYAVERQLTAVATAGNDSVSVALRTANEIADEDADASRRIGGHGVGIIAEIAARKDGPVNILTHCNAGWLAFVDWGTATAPIYAAQEKGIALHVWVDETRPRNQGARLTAWELSQAGIPHTVIADNTGGHLMQHGRVDMCIVGSDRTTHTGYVANKIGTYLKALAAKDNGIPFYVALPSSSIDWNMRDGLRDIPIEERDGREVSTIEGLHDDEICRVQLTYSPTANYAFDVTPPHLVTGLITERGICEPTEHSIGAMFPERGNRE